jgi:hypothetical protein
MENYLNKDAIITIFFADYHYYGAKPQQVIGKIINIYNDFVSIEFDPNRKENKSIKNFSGQMLVNKQYLISVIVL